ncbi:hypothetical protein QAD02_013921 [Eretmocerus hayati]|uniref:Uncharacterized protein n=1 Tax=Eretmocerus hayati TaxID=131215 RepID=A0ACC2P495_9HYME|nr:hypothetical protein QAD02_013921 [Eretmocerus hayati]
MLDSRIGSRVCSSLRFCATGLSRLQATPPVNELLFFVRTWILIHLTQTMEKSIKSDVEKTLETQLSDIKNSMANIESKLMEQDNKISTIEAKVDRLGSDNKATNDGPEQCKSDIMGIHDAVDAIKNKVATLVTEAILSPTYTLQLHVLKIWSIPTSGDDVS